MRFRHLVFDLDGTLVDSRADLAASVNRLRVAMSAAPLDLDRVSGFVGDGARKLVERATADIEGVDLDEALSSFLADYGAHCLDHTDLYPGVRTTLRRLHAAGVRLSILTNKPAHMTAAILGGLGIAPLLCGFIGGDAMPALKPDPAALRRLMVESGVPNWRTLMVGDSPVDGQTAVNGGVDFCGVLWGLRSLPLRLTGWVRVIDTPSELLALVGAGKSEPGPAGARSGAGVGATWRTSERDPMRSGGRS